MSTFKNLEEYPLEINKKNKKHLHGTENVKLKQYLVKSNTSSGKIINSKYQNLKICSKQIKYIIDNILHILFLFYREKHIEIYKNVNDKNLIFEDLKKNINPYDNISITIKNLNNSYDCETKYQIEAELNIIICKVKVYKKIFTYLFDDLEFIIFESQLKSQRIKFKNEDHTLSDNSFSIENIESVEINGDKYNITVKSEDDDFFEILDVSFKVLFDLYNFTNKEIPQHVLLNDAKVNKINQVIVSAEHNINGV